MLNKLTALRNKKGFTLVEIIIVLVIVAILVAATIPAMIGFVNNARGQAFSAEARVGLNAAQAVVTEITASERGTVAANGTITWTSPATGVAHLLAHPNFALMVQDVEGVTYNDAALAADDNPFRSITVDTNNNRVTGMVYRSGASGNVWWVRIVSGTTEVVRGNAATPPTDWNIPANIYAP
ncbi:MAG: prepilin-type N-terminal cleavage/methylation domain-containing protein [Oscillospiraceae bacterium]|nr:prepilin-type N-terminal cleavage/methylation domain-containing protein [Oscillospiraceae bacterium]